MAKGIAFEFLRQWFGDAAFHLTLWRSDTKNTIWTNPENKTAIEAFEASANAGNFDAYFGVCLQSRAGGPASRGSNETAAVMPGLWVDLDFAEKPHSGAQPRKKNYPPPDVVDRALQLMPIAPSCRIVTGGGIHAYWKFTKPFVLASADAQARAAELVKSWQGLIKSNLLKLGGFGADSTHDLARVLRLPGTPHTKHPGLVVSYDKGYNAQNWPVNDLAKFEAYLYGERLPIESGAKPGAKESKPAATTARPAAAKPADPVKSGGAESAGRPAMNFTATQDSEPPSVRLFNMLEASPEFKAVWSGKKKYASPSEYDMALANFAINAGWEPNDVAALLAAFHRTHSPDHLKKLFRVTGGKFDYLELTISKAYDKRRIEEKQSHAETSIESLAIEVRRAEQEGREIGRDVVLSRVSEFLGVKVVGFRQTGRRDEVYSLLVVSAAKKPQEVIIGGANVIHSSPSRLCERIMADCGKYVAISAKLKKEWGAIVAALIAVREFHEVSESDLCERVRFVVDEYLHRHRGAHNGDDESTRSAKIRTSKPFFWKGELYLIASDLKKIASEQDKGLAGGDIFVGLRQLGFEQITLSLGGEGGKTSRSYWHGPFERDSENGDAFP